MNKKMKLLLALMVLLEYGSEITEVHSKQFIVRGDSQLYGTIDEEDMILSHHEIIEMAETYCKNQMKHAK